MSESNERGAPAEPLEIEVREEKRSVEGFRVWLRVPGLHRDLAMYSFVLKRSAADKLAAALRAALSGSTEEKPAIDPKDAYCWGYLQAWSDHGKAHRVLFEERQAEAEQAWERDRPHLESGPTEFDVRSTRAEGTQPLAPDDC